MQEYELPKRITHGEDGVIFQIADGLVAKICWGEPTTRYEASIAEKLHESEISVPHPYGIHPISFPDEKICSVYAGETYNGFVMEKIEGKTGFQGENLDERIEMCLLRNEELRKARNLGFIPYDSNYPGNIIFTPERKIVLIDFVGWRYKPQQPEKSTQ